MENNATLLESLACEYREKLTTLMDLLQSDNYDGKEAAALSCDIEYLRDVITQEIAKGGVSVSCAGDCSVCSGCAQGYKGEEK